LLGPIGVPPGVVPAARQRDSGDTAQVQQRFRHGPVRAASRWFVLGLLALLVAACGGSATPTANPGLSSQLVGAIVRRMPVSAVVSGDSACSDPSLIPNALHITVLDPSTETSRDVYVYSFRNASWPASQAMVDACQQAYGGAAGAGADIDRLDLMPYRLLGRDWSQILRDDLSAALDEASQAGTPEQNAP
jgi:hypothetical protein